MFFIIEKQKKLSSLYVKLSSSQLNKLKSGVKNGTEVTLNLSWNVIADSNGDFNFPHNYI